MAYCSDCLNLETTNKSSLSRLEYWCRELHKYVSPNDRTCRYFRQNPDGSQSDTSCFLTTACMRHMNENFDDNCVELLILRWFRDKYVSQEDIDHYYKIAPTVVEVLDNIEDGNQIYKFIHNNVIKVCVSDIMHDKIGEAYAIYKNTMIYLEEKYAKPYLEEQLVLTLKNVQAKAY